MKLNNKQIPLKFEKPILVYYNSIFDCISIRIFYPNNTNEMMLDSNSKEFKQDFILNESKIPTINHNYEILHWEYL